MRMPHLALALSLFATACAGVQPTQEAEVVAAKATPAPHADLNWKAVKAAQSAGAVLVDARGATSYAKGHIPGAISVPVRDDAAMSRLPADKATRLVFYCGGPRCPASTRAADKAGKAGYTDVVDFRGGFPAWQARYGLDGSVRRAVPEGITVLDWPGVKAAMATGAVLVDSRGSKGFANGHIDGAINVPCRDEAAHSALPADKSAVIIFYCSGPVCSASTKGAEKALEMGYTQVKEYRGGYPDWASRR